MNPAMKGFLFLDMFGYDPTFKFAAYRSQLGSLMTIIALWWFVLYLIVTLGYFLLGSPVPSNEYNSVSAVRPYLSPARPWPSSAHAPSSIFVFFRPCPSPVHATADRRPGCRLA
jgi:hypothetical protein